MKFIIVYVTHSDEVSAQKMADWLIENRYAACANLFPISSAYWWDGAIESKGEFVSILKTIPENWNAIQTIIEKRHAYKVPCIMKIEVAANAAYAKWIYDNVDQQD